MVITVLRQDRQSVQVQYFTNSATMTGFMVPGSPYLTFQFEESTPQLTSGQGSITSINGNTVGSGATVFATGTEFEVVNNIGTYIVYSLNGALTFEATQQTLTANNQFTGVLRVVKLNQTEHKTILDQYAANYPTGVTTDYSFSGNDATLTFTWNVVGNAANLLMLSWPHHR